jgi:hypothetical protein
LKQLQSVVRNHLQQTTEPVRERHIDLQQSGDVPDTPPVALSEDGEILSENVVVRESDSVEDTRVILQLLDDIDSHIKLDPPVSSLLSFSNSGLLTTPDSLLECSCCTGELKIV